MIVDRLDVFANSQKRTFSTPRAQSDPAAEVKEGRFDVPEKLVNEVIEGLGASRGFGEGAALVLREWESGLPIVKRVGLSPVEIIVERKKFFEVIKKEKEDLEDINHAFCIQSAIFFQCRPNFVTVCPINIFAICNSHIFPACSFAV